MSILDLNLYTTRQLLLLIVTACLLSHSAKADDQKVTIVLAGDSTVTDSAGWGGGFSHLLNANAKCINMAAGGRSSRSFRTEGRWKKCVALKPDYILIQFGHNDQPGKGEVRETDPMTTYREFLRKYVNEAREVGSKPILVTSLTRRRFENGKIQSILVPYAAAVRLIGQELNVPVVDLHTRSILLCEKLGPQGCKEISPKDGTDRTHLNAKGAKLIAPLIVDELRTVSPDLSSFFTK